MKKTLIYISVVTLLLSGCGTPPVEEESLDPFYISVRSFEDLQQDATLERHGKVIGENDIIVTSQVAARVEELPITIGTEIKKDWLVIKLQDSTGSYSFAAQRANTQLNSARINYDSTLVSLDKAINDTTLGIQQAQTQYAAADQEGRGSSALQIDQLNTQVDKAEFDYETQLTANDQTIDNFIETAANIGKDIELLFASVRTATDTILGVSSLYERENDSYERQLGARNTETKRTAEQELRTLLSQETQYINLSLNVEEGSLTSYLNDMKDLLYAMRPVLEATDTMLEYSTTSQSFSQTQLTTLIATIDGLQSQIQVQISLITAQVNTIQSFLATYQQQEASLRTQVDITKQQIASTKSSLGDGEINAQLGLEGAKNSFETATKSREATLAALANGIDQARISSNEAQNQLAKLEVKTPIDGIIGDIFVDVGQEVAPGTPLFSISSTNKQQIEVALSSSELDLVTVGQDVSITNGKTMGGILVSVSKTADRNFTYKAIVQLSETGDILGELVDVSIPIQHIYPLIPITNLTILNTISGLLPTRKDGGIDEIQVELGEVRGKQIEILSEINPKTQVITSDISNFDENKYELTLKN